MIIQKIIKLKQNITHFLQKFIEFFTADEFVASEKVGHFAGMLDFLSSSKNNQS